MARLLTASMFLLFVLGSCKKEEDPKPSPNVPITTTYNYLNSECDPYQFRVGSYWVYENDSTGVLDSVIVDSVKSGYVVTIPSVHGNTGETKTEIFKVYFHAFGSAEFYHLTLINSFYVRNFSGDYGVFSGQDIFAVNRPVGTSNDGMTIVAKYPFLTVGSNTFNNVDKSQIIAAAQSLPEFAFDTDLYFCDSVGLVKKETHLSPGNIESWSLKRWNIVR